MFGEDGNNVVGLEQYFDRNLVVVLGCIEDNLLECINLSGV